jgi:hypothetical protein
MSGRLQKYNAVATEGGKRNKAYGKIRTAAFKHKVQRLSFWYTLMKYNLCFT